MTGAPTPAGYEAARTGAVLFERDDRYFLRVEGRAPAAMLKGMVTGALPPEFTLSPDGIRSGRAPYSLLLTVKGRPVTDLRLFREESGDAGALLIDLSLAGEEGTREHFARFLPPRMARLVAPEPRVGMLTLAGPGAAGLLSEELFAGAVGPSEFESLKEGEECIGSESRVVRSGDLDVPAFDLVAPEPALAALRDRLLAGGAVRGEAELRTILRVERGRPEYGADFDEGTLPPEVGLERRAIDHTKGCYTGQEVIVRIRDRGKVNRLLRGLLLGDAPLPPPGTPLFLEGRERPAGEVRSAVQSPRFGEGVALALVRREAEPGSELRLGEPGGPQVRVRGLEGG